MSKLEWFVLIVVIFLGLHFYNQHRLEEEIGPIVRMVRPATPEGKPPVVVALGDSLTAGVGADAGGDYPTQLGRMLGFDVINRGRAGEASKATAARIASILQSDRPDIVLIEVGFDDMRNARSRATIAIHLRTIVGAVQHAGAMPVVIGVPNLDLVDLGIGSDADFYEEVALEKGVPYVPDVFGPVLTDQSFKSDLTFPSAKGYEHAARTIYERLKGILQ